MLADETGPDPEGQPAPPRLKSRVYSRLLAEQAATGRLLSVTETRQSGRSLCVFETAVERAPLSERVKSMNPCYVCHARQLAEHLDHAPIFWPNCPYAEYHRG
jgi:hypothetical protein